MSFLGAHPDIQNSADHGPRSLPPVRRQKRDSSGFTKDQARFGEVHISLAPEEDLVESTATSYEGEAGDLRQKRSAKPALSLFEAAVAGSFLNVNTEENAARDKVVKVKNSGSVPLPRRADLILDREAIKQTKPTAHHDSPSRFPTPPIPGAGEHRRQTSTISRAGVLTE